MPLLLEPFWAGGLPGHIHHLLRFNPLLHFSLEVNWHVFERDLLCFSKDEYLCLGTDCPKPVNQTYEIVIHAQIFTATFVNAEIARFRCSRDK